MPHSLSDGDDSEPPAAPRGAAAAAGRPPVGAKPYVSEADNPSLFSSYRSQFSRFSVDQLKARLKINNMKTGGTKGELVERCVDAAINGVVPQCPMCRQGFLRRDRASPAEARARGLPPGSWVYHCPGRFDDRLNRKVDCAFVADHIERAPWKH